MKTLLTSALTLCLLIAVGCAEGNTSSPEADAVIANATNKVEANVEGMDCSGCSGAIVAAVEAIDGVQAASADVASGDVKVALADDIDAGAKLIEIEAVLQELQEGKYTVKTITATHNTDGQATPTEKAPSEEPAAEEPAGDEQASTSNQIYVMTAYKVTGMDCSGCSSQIVKAVEQVDGVQKVEADHKTGTVSVALDDETKTDEVKNVIAALSDGKFTVSQ